MWTWLRVITYPFRYLGGAIIFYEPACAGKLCARPTVGFSAWCRKHTDMILAGEEPPYTKKQRESWRILEERLKDGKSPFGY